MKDQIPWSELAFPLPDWNTQFNRCAFAINMLKPFLDTFEDALSKSSIEALSRCKKTVEQIKKVRRWHTHCALAMPVLDRTSANYRITRNLQREVQRKLDKEIFKNYNIPAAEAFTAWGRVCFEILAEAICTCDDFVQTREWRYLDTTLHTLTKQWERYHPYGEDLGTEFFHSIKTIEFKYDKTR